MPAELTELKLAALQDFVCTLTAIADCGCENLSEVAGGFQCQTVTKHGSDVFCNPCMAKSVLEQYKQAYE